MHILDSGMYSMSLDTTSCSFMLFLASILTLVSYIATSGSLCFVIPQCCVCDAVVEHKALLNGKDLSVLGWLQVLC